MTTAWFTQTRQVLGKWFRRVWPNEMDGKYSISRLRAFEAYRQDRSLLWMALVVLLTPVPSALVAIGLNFFPLETPQQGWKHQYMLFLRLFVETQILTQCSRWQREFYFADTKSRIQFDWGFRLVIGMVITGSFIGGSACVQFPMPFGLLLAVLIGSPLMFLVSRFMVRKVHQTMTKVSMRFSTSATRSVHSGDVPTEQVNSANDSKACGEPNANANGGPLDLMVRPNGVQFFNRMVRNNSRMIMLQMMLMFVYPVFEVGYNALDGNNRTLYFLAQPVLRKILSVVYRHQAQLTPDLTNEMLVFSVRLMAALFRSIFFVTSSSLPVVISITWDLIELGYCFSKINSQYDRIEAILAQLGPTRFTRLRKSDFVNESVVYVDQNIKFLLTQSSRHHLDWIGSNGVALYKTSWLAGAFSKTFRDPRRRSYAMVFVGSARKPTENAQLLKSHEPAWQQQQQNQQLLLIKETSKLMSLLEYVVLGDYSKTIVPFFYAVYIALSGVSPCRSFLRNLSQYEHNGHELSGAVSDLFVYATIGLATFCLLCLGTKWRLGFNLVEVLAFVLETHFKDVQAKMIFFLVLVFDCNLLHYGVDFSFKFDK